MVEVGRPGDIVAVLYIDQQEDAYPQIKALYDKICRLVIRCARFRFGRLGTDYRIGHIFNQAFMRYLKKPLRGARFL